MKWGAFSTHDKVMLGCLGAVTIVPLTLLLAAYLMTVGRGRMTQATSPDGRYRITLDERTCSIDRNFYLYLWDRKTGKERRIGWEWSNDQSPGIEREHFVWSPDSKKVALVGDRYFAIPEATLPTGDQVCLVYDVEQDKFYSNHDTNEGYEPFTAEQAVDVFGDAILQPAPPIE